MIKVEITNCVNMNSRQVRFFLYWHVENVQFCIISIGLFGWLSGILNFPIFHKNVNSLEVWKYISRNSLPKGLDLPQVDLMNFRVEYVRSRSGQASDEVARGWLVSLEGFSFAFRAKDEVWCDRQLVRWHLVVEWRKSVPLQLYVCAFLLRWKSKLNLFTLYQSD